MKRLMLSSIVCAMAIMPMAAQQKGNAGVAHQKMDAEKRAKVMTEKLQLNEKQQKKLYKLFTSEDKKLKKILTDEQYQRFEKMQAEGCKARHEGQHRDMQMRDRRAEGRPDGRIEGRPQGRPEGRLEGGPDGRFEGRPQGRPQVRPLQHDANGKPLPPRESRPKLQQEEKVEAAE